jgi:plastocyanin
MPRFCFLIGGTSLAAVTAGALLLWPLAEAAAPSPAPMGHAMMDHGAHAPAAKKVKAAANEVVIDQFQFGPAVLNVPVGTKVTWTNDDSDPHTVTSEAEPKLLKSPPLDTGESFAFTFDKPGTYRYFCAIHPRMQGVVVVQ